MSSPPTPTSARSMTPHPAPPLEGRGEARAAIWTVGAVVALGLLVIVGGVVGTILALVTGQITWSDLLPLVVAALVVPFMLPRGKRFAPPGPRLIRGEQPDLFAALDNATAAVGCRQFDEVYIDGSAEGRVILRGGIIGAGRERTFQVGAALLQTMSVDHLRALVAHEALRYYSPTNKLESFVERGRTRSRLGIREFWQKSSITAMPFRAIAHFFLNRTDALSRGYVLQLDDRVSAAIGGWQTAEMIKVTSGLSAVLEAYGKVYRGPDGPRFEEFVATEDASKMLAFARFRQSEWANSKHREPAVPDRLGRLHDAAQDSRPFDERPAAFIVRGFEEMAAQQMADRFARK